MEESTKQQVKFVPAICPKCGGQLEVDPSQEAAVCQYCGAAFIVDKAVQNYNVEHAKIDHVDSVNVDLKGSVDSVLTFLDKQIKDGREDKKEEKRLKAESERDFLKNSWKIFAVMFAVLIIMMVLGNLLGFFK